MQQTPVPASPRLSSWLTSALVLVGALQLILVFRVSARSPDLASRLGFIIGTTAFWPLIFVGLFSIGRRFRNPRSHAIILITVWSIFILSHLGNKVKSAQQLRLVGPIPSHAANASEKSSFPVPVSNRAATSTSSSLSAAATTGLEYDFSKGSDERLIKQIERVQQERYQQVEMAYAQACAARPQDAVLALERVKFIEHFVYAEDISIESAESDHEVALNYLKTMFPEAPGTVLYELGNIFDDEFEAKAAKYAHLVPRWGAADRAQFFLLKANVAKQKGASARVKWFAKLSFDAEPTPAAGLLLANLSHTANQRTEAMLVLMNPVFDRAEPWTKKAKMDLLFDLDYRNFALSLFEDLKKANPELVQDSETALRLANAGYVNLARKIFERDPTNSWNHRNRFEFELKYGDAGQAGEAYRELRKGGLRSDPLLRDRLTLFWKYPGLGWNLDDLLGALLLALSLVGAAIAPFVLLLPVHYWSLLRERQGKPSAWPDTFWGLRAAWLTLGMLLLAELSASWIFQPEILRAWWSGFEVQVAIKDGTRLAQQTLWWVMIGVVLLLLLWRSRAWGLFQLGQWTLGKTIGRGLAATLLLRIGLLVYALIWPGAISEEIASSSPETGKLCFALLGKFGAVGLIAVLAGLVPLLEEVLFRGVLLQAFARHIPFAWANATQALLFAAIHENLRLLPFFFAFGFVAGLLTRKADSLWPAMILHASNNLLACLGILLLNRVPS